MGYFANKAVEIIEEYERLVPLTPHSVRIALVAKNQSVLESEVEAVIYPWIDGDFDYSGD